jgi:hypothetical protein
MVTNPQIQPPARFRIERVTKIIEGTTFARLQRGLHTILHVVPLASCDGGKRFETALSHLHRKGRLQPLFSTSTHRLERNSDGCLIYSGLSPSSSIGSYLQVFRSGALESVNTLAQRQNTPRENRIPFLDIELRMLQVLPQYFSVLQCLGLRPPVVLGLSLTGVMGRRIEIPSVVASSSVYPRGKPIREDTLFLPEAVVATFDCDLGEVLKPAFDGAWRAAGWEGSIFYEGSEWVGLAKNFSDQDQLDR